LCALELQPVASLNQTQARSIFQSSYCDGDGLIAQDELKHRNEVVLILPCGCFIINGQDTLSFLDGGDQGLIV
jgi:hypothetical protein